MNCQGEEQQSLPGKTFWIQWCVEPWDKVTLPGWCDIWSALRNGVKFRAKITMQQREAQITVFISPFGLKQDFIQCWLSILFQQLTLRKNFFLIKPFVCRAAGQKLGMWSNLNSNVYYGCKQFMCHCLNSQFEIPGVEHSWPSLKQHIWLCSIDFGKRIIGLETTRFWVVIVLCDWLAV